MMEVLLITTSQGSAGANPAFERLRASLCAAADYAGNVRVTSFCLFQGVDAAPSLAREHPLVRFVLLATPEKLGVSAARNRLLDTISQSGLRVSDYSWVGFPDDDCAYPADLLASLRAVENGGILILKHAAECTIGEPRHCTPMPITLAIKQASSNVGFFAGNLLRADDRFDERFGVGAQLGSAEDVEFLARVWSRTRPLIRACSQPVIHPRKPGRQARYYLGNIRVLELYRSLPGFKWLLARQWAVGLALVLSGQMKFRTLWGALAS